MIRQILSKYKNNSSKQDLDKRKGMISGVLISVKNTEGPEFANGIITLFDLDKPGYGEFEFFKEG
jgi:hypothetical protein